MTMKNVTLLFLLIISILQQNALAFHWVQSGVISNLAVINNRVILQQADNTLTSLAMDSGTVLARGTDRFEELELHVIGNNLVGWSFYGEISGVDSRHLGVKWRKRFDGHFDLNPVQSDGQFLIRRTQSRLERLDPSNGNVIWMLPVPINSSFVLASGRILLCSGDASSHIQLLQASDGSEIWGKEFQRDSNSLRIYLTGQNAYILEANFDEPETDADFDGLNYDPETCCEEFNDTSTLELHTYSLSGANVENRVVPIQKRIWFSGENITISDVIYKSDQTLLNPVMENFKNYHEVQQDGDLPGYWTTGDGMQESGMFQFPLSSGTLAYSTSVFDRIPKVVLTFTSGDDLKWRAYVPYLNNWRFAITAVRQYENKLLLGTSSGQVECLDVNSGYSKWKYTFPVPIVPVFTELAPPMKEIKRIDAIWVYSMRDSAQKFNHAYRLAQQTGNSIIIPEGVTTSTAELNKLSHRRRSSSLRQTFDNAVLSPYAELPQRLVLAWIAAIVLGVSVVLIIHRYHAKRSAWDTTLVTAAGFSLSTLALARFGYTSLPILTALALVATAYTVLILSQLVWFIKLRCYPDAVVLILLITLLVADLFKIALIIVPDTPPLM